MMELWKGEQTVIVIDAVSSGSPPGTVHRFDVTEHPLRERMFRDSTHAFSLQEAVELSRVLHKLPKRLIVYGMEAKSFAITDGLSAEVSRALPDLVARILEEVDALWKPNVGNDQLPRTGSR
jgi:hydrogenase maturation protease